MHLLHLNDFLVNISWSSEKNGILTVICKSLGLALLRIQYCHILPPDPSGCRLLFLLCSQTFP